MKNFQHSEIKPIFPGVAVGASDSQKPLEKLRKICWKIDLHCKFCVKPS